jgi:hypothetical protein
MSFLSLRLEGNERFFQAEERPAFGFEVNTMETG